MSNIRVCTKCDTAFTLRSTLDRETRCQTCRGSRHNRYSNQSNQRAKALEWMDEVNDRLTSLEKKLLALEEKANEEDVASPVESLIDERLKYKSTEMQDWVEKKVLKLNGRILKLTEEVEKVKGLLLKKGGYES